MENPQLYASAFQSLKVLLHFVSEHPTILNTPLLGFLKTFIEKFGGTVPPGECELPDWLNSAFGGAAGEKSEAKPTEPASDEPEEEEMDESDSISDIELDMEGVIEPDEPIDQPMGDLGKLPTEEEIEEANTYRSQAAVAYSEQKYDEAVTLYSKAIELNPGNAFFHAKRGQALLKLQKPNACIRDCDQALDINCDSASAYKFRGRAHRLLGNWELAAKDLRQACKLDFDEEADEWLREVTPNAKNIEQHRIKQERRAFERKSRKQQQDRKQAKDEQKSQQQQQEQQKKNKAGSRGAFDMNDLPKHVTLEDILNLCGDIAGTKGGNEPSTPDPAAAKPKSEPQQKQTIADDDLD